MGTRRGGRRSWRHWPRSYGLSETELLAASRCLGWTVLDVITHVHMGLQDMLLGAVSPAAAGEVPDRDAGSYWLESPGGNLSEDQLAHLRSVRLVSAAYRRPERVVAHLRVTADGVASAAARLTPGAVRSQGHVLATGDFLATWAVEVTVHHLDLGGELAAGDRGGARSRLAA